MLLLDNYRKPKKNNRHSKSVFHMDGIGNIDIMWGGTNEALSQIIKKYIVKTAVFDSVDDMIEKIRT